MENWPTKKLKEVKDSETKDLFLVALDQLFKNGAFLLEAEVHERSISHKLAEYLQQQFSGWHVDCEYNLHGVSTKILPRECNGKRKKYVYPDIVVHHRNTDDNLLVIEIKSRENEVVDECDNAKLMAFTSQDGEYKYQLGLFIGFDKLNKPQIIWYRNGKIEN